MNVDDDVLVTGELANKDIIADVLRPTPFQPEDYEDGDDDNDVLLHTVKRQEAEPAVGTPQEFLELKKSHNIVFRTS